LTLEAGNFYDVDLTMDEEMTGYAKLKVAEKNFALKLD
jgi:hypothetical protein